MATATLHKIQIQDIPATEDGDIERWWWDELGVLVEHEVWHLPQIAQEQTQN